MLKSQVTGGASFGSRSWCGTDLPGVYALVPTVRTWIVKEKKKLRPLNIFL